ncbi:MAG: glycine C-acetyltransferase [Endozoicomonadaceae bacterium]|nr:glycine C-acetyltransferase [Endozoicomonadaceae bacterium]
MKEKFYAHLKHETENLKKESLYKEEHVIQGQQQAVVDIDTGTKVLNFCANNYLGLANSPILIQKAKDALEQYGYGMASVRFICGTQNIHKELEAKISAFLQLEDTILYSSCFDANTGLFETILGPEDAIISDSLNHASIIDGVRLCKAKRYRYQNNCMDDLEQKLKQADADNARHKLIATDGVFSMDGIIANLNGICDRADKYNALVMVDDCHAAGFIGEHGRGTHEYCGVKDRVDIITGTLGKALGGASGGYTSGRKEVIDWLRNRSRPYLFSNTLCPVIAATSIAVFEILENSHDLRKKIHENSARFRQKMTSLGFNLAGQDHPIIPVMLGDAALTKHFAGEMMQRGIYVTGFSFPVVPKNKARIRTQMSAAHSKEHIDQAVAAFAEVGKKLNII